MNKVVSWIKENKVAAAAVAGLAFLFMAKKGGGGDGGGEAVPEDDNEGSPGYAVGVPFGPDYDTSEAALIDRDDYKEGIDIGLDLAREAYERELEDEETATDEPPPDDPTPTPVDDKQGITIRGKFFRHATGFTVTNVDGHGWTEYLIKYDGKADRWQEKNGQWLKGWTNPTRDRNRDAPKDEPKRDQDDGNAVRRTTEEQIKAKQESITEIRRRPGPLTKQERKDIARKQEKKEDLKKKAAQQTKQHTDAGPTSGTKVQGKTNTVRKKAVRTAVKSR